MKVVGCVLCDWNTCIQSYAYSMIMRENQIYDMYHGNVKNCP